MPRLEPTSPVATPRFVIGLALVIISCGLLAVQTDGAMQVLVRVVQVGSALIGAIILVPLARARKSP